MMKKMQWTHTLSEAIMYIEEHLTDEINNNVIEKIVSSSYYNFERVFAFIFDMTVSEYIRNRRLSLAAVDLIESDFKIIDIALKYGYETHESFARAFVRFHNILPSEAKEKVFSLKYCYKAEIEANIKFNIKIGKLNEITTQYTFNKSKIKKSYEINLSSLIPSNNVGIVNINSNELTATCQDDVFSLMTRDEYHLPLKIDFVAKTNSNNLKLIFGQGDLTLNWKYKDWDYKINELMIHDIITKECFGYPEKGKIECNNYLNISWIITKEFMALVINDELRYYNEYLPYIKEILKIDRKSYCSKVGIAPVWGSIISLNKLTINELL